MKNVRPKVSVSGTCYKKSDYIKETLNSILNQTYKNFELIFVYDDEDKNDLLYVKELLQRFKKKKIIINKKNLGVAKSQKKALKNYKGTFISFIDADDIWKKNKLQFQINFMIKNNVIFSFTSYVVINEENKIIKSRIVPRSTNYKNLVKTNFIGLSTVIFRKSIHSKVKFPQLKTQEDFALWLLLVRQGIKLVPINQKLSFWRKTDNSLSSNTFQKIKDAFTLFYKLENKNFILSIFSVITISYNKILKNI